MEKYGVAPNPGSEAAIALGCTCPMLDNLMGEGIKSNKGEVLFIYNSMCPVHVLTTQNKEEHV